MMYQGVLGTFFFTVTDMEVATFRDLKQQREIQFAEHKCVSGLPKVQHTGRNLDTLSLTVQLFPLTPLALTVDMRIESERSFRRERGLSLWIVTLACRGIFWILLCPNRGCCSLRR